jgi:hypothetical protein
MGESSYLAIAVAEALADVSPPCFRDLQCLPLFSYFFAASIFSLSMPTKSSRELNPL